MTKCDCENCKLVAEITSGSVAVDTVLMRRGAAQERERIEAALLAEPLDCWCCAQAHAVTPDVLRIVRGKP